MQRSIPIATWIPLSSDRPVAPPRVAPAVRRRVASIAWAAALVAVGLYPTSVMAEDGHAAAVTALRSATDVLPIAAASKAGPDLHALYGEYRDYLQTSNARTRGPSDSHPVTPWRG